MPPEIEITTPGRYERYPQETAVAYAAFLAYLRLGPTRSIDRAWRKSKNISDEGKRAPRHWFLWSAKYGWQQRARAWDEHCEEVERLAEEARRKELAARRAEMECQVQEALQRRYARTEDLLKKLEAAPVTDVIRIEKKDGTIENRVKGLDVSGYARLSKEFRDLGNQAILGPRPEKKPDETYAPMPPFIVRTAVNSPDERENTSRAA